MAERVVPTAEAIGANVYKPVAEVTVESCARFVSRSVTSGKRVFDVGIEGNVGRSKFYAAESARLSKMGLERVYRGTLDVKGKKREDERQPEAARIWNLRYLASRYDREEIYDKIWSQPIQHVAKEYKVSDVYLIKVCKKLDIPRPGVGYWAKKAAGKSLPVTPPLKPIQELSQE